MPTQGERQNYMWRPNTNDSTTLARYDQEAAHWTRAFKNATTPKANFGGTMNVVALVLQLVIVLVWLIFDGIASILVYLFEPKKTVPVKNKVSPKDDKWSDENLRLGEEELIEYLSKGPVPVGNFDDDTIEWIDFNE